MINNEIIVNFYDCDPAGIIFYANIFKYAHSNYEKMISSFELDLDYFVNNNFIVPIIHTEADYFKPLKTGEKISIQTVVSRLKDSSFELTHKFFGSENDLRAEVKTVHVFVDKKSFQKTKIDETIFRKLNSHQV